MLTATRRDACAWLSTHGVAARAAVTTSRRGPGRTCTACPFCSRGTTWPSAYVLGCTSHHACAARAYADTHTRLVFLVMLGNEVRASSNATERIATWFSNATGSTRVATACDRTFARTSTPCAIDADDLRTGAQLPCERRDRRRDRRPPRALLARGAARRCSTPCCWCPGLSPRVCANGYNNRRIHADTWPCLDDHIE